MFGQGNHILSPWRAEGRIGDCYLLAALAAAAAQDPAHVKSLFPEPEHPQQGKWVVQLCNKLGGPRKTTNYRYTGFG